MSTPDTDLDLQAFGLPAADTGTDLVCECGAIIHLDAGATLGDAVDAAAEHNCDDPQETP